MCLIKHMNSFVFTLPDLFKNIFMFEDTEIPPLSVTSHFDTWTVEGKYKLWTTTEASNKTDINSVVIDFFVLHFYRNITFLSDLEYATM
jgi:hypothetical protein